MRRIIIIALLLGAVLLFTKFAPKLQIGGNGIISGTLNQASK